MADREAFSNQDFVLTLLDDSVRITGTNLTTELQFAVNQTPVSLHLSNFNAMVEAKVYPTQDGQISLNLTALQISDVDSIDFTANETSFTTELLFLNIRYYITAHYDFTTKNLQELSDSLNPFFAYSLVNATNVKTSASQLQIYYDTYNSSQAVE